MNFYDLSAKLRAIEESSVAECGDMMPMPMMPHAPEQQDSVTMNVSMNGNGSGGIKDLMNILRNIEQAAEHDHEHHDHEEPMITQPHDMDGDVDVVLGTADEDMLADPDAKSGGGDESYGNSAPGGSDAHQFGIDAMTRHGDDMHSKGSVKRLRVNGGENPLQEALVERLSAMYQEIKEAKGKRTMSRAAKGYEKYGKKGMEALAKAGRDGASEKKLDTIRNKYDKYDEGSIQEASNAFTQSAPYPSFKKKQRDHDSSVSGMGTDDGDESAKKQLQALKDKKERMRNNHNDRMER